MDLSKLDRGEVIAIVGGFLLAVSIFLHWYESVSSLATLAGHHGKGSYSAWQAHKILRFLLLLAAIAPIVLGWIIVRDHALSWPRGQLTSVIAITVLGLMFYNGVIDRPGDPSSQINLQIGWFVGMLGGVLMLVGSVMRQQESELQRKPPGTI